MENDKKDGSLVGIILRVQDAMAKSQGKEVTLNMRDVDVMVQMMVGVLHTREQDRADIKQGDLVIKGVDWSWDEIVAEEAAQNAID